MKYKLLIDVCGDDAVFIGQLLSYLLEDDTIASFAVDGIVKASDIIDQPICFNQSTFKYSIPTDSGHCLVDTGWNF